LSSVRIISTNKTAVINALETLVKRLKTRPEVLEVHLCGSWAKGNYSPYSDVDLLIVIKDDGRMPHDRVPHYLPDSFPLGLDLFIYTVDELEKSRFARELLKDAVRLWSSNPAHLTTSSQIRMVFQR